MFKVDISFFYRNYGDDLIFFSLCIEFYFHHLVLFGVG